MAAKKKSKKKRSEKQIAATNKLVALNKKKGGKKKAGKKKAGKKKAVKNAKKASSAPAKKTRKKAKRAKKAPFTKTTRSMPDGSVWMQRADGSWAAVRGPGLGTKKKRKSSGGKKAAKKSTPKPSTKTLTAKDILSGRATGSTPSNVSAIWVCAGPKRTGCGGGVKGRKGSRVVGVFR